MSRPEIIDKLEKLFIRCLPFREENQVVYLFVEIAKLLDRDANKNYPLLRFYRDWLVHTQKDRISKTMKLIMEDIYADVYNELSNGIQLNHRPKIIGFVYMEDMMEQIQFFLAEYGIEDNLTIEKTNWLSLVALMVQILADQPLVNPCTQIREFCFLPTSKGQVRGIITLQNKIGHHDIYNFGSKF